MNLLSLSLYQSQSARPDKLLGTPVSPHWIRPLEAVSPLSADCLEVEVHGELRGSQPQSRLQWTLSHGLAVSAVSSESASVCKRRGAVSRKGSGGSSGHV